MKRPVMTLLTACLVHAPPDGPLAFFRKVADEGVDEVRLVASKVRVRLV